MSPARNMWKLGTYAKLKLSADKPDCSLKIEYPAAREHQRMRERASDAPGPPVRVFA